MILGEGRPSREVAIESGPAPAGLLETLMAVVRPEFRQDVLVFDARHPVFGGPPCKVPSCDRPARNGGLCWAHHNRWWEAGKPDKEEFAATTSRLWRHRTPFSCCAVTGCGYGAHANRLCSRHLRAWERARRPDLSTWQPPPPVPGPVCPPRVCQVSWCDLWAHAGTPFCQGHCKQWRRLGLPDEHEFATSYDHNPTPLMERIELNLLTGQLKLEIQYVIQCRHDERPAITLPVTVNHLIRFLAARGVASLLDHSEQAWKQLLPPRGKGRSLLIYAHRRIDDLAFGAGWEAEYPRRVWRLRKLGFDGDRTICFDRIPQPWLADLAKRWARWRLATGLADRTVNTGVKVVTWFGIFLSTLQPSIDGLGQIDRAVLERYLAHTHAERAGMTSHGDYIGQLDLFLRAIRQHGWDPSLPTNALFFHEDLPKAPTDKVPRALAEHVMAQVENPANLARWNNPAYRLVTLILIRCGLRHSDATRLPFDCIVSDTDSAPYLRYYNHKMKREALVPIDTELRDEIHNQQQRLRDRWTTPPPVLFPRRTANLDGAKPLSSSVHRKALYRWLELCDVRDELGRPVHFTPHQWRHTLATRLINRDVPQEIVRRILDHNSHAMTAHYARLHDTTVRRHWEQARKVNTQGQTVTMDPDGPLAEAAWAKHRLSRATQALPNGYCSLPLVQSCPHANACLTCPMFITTAEFLPQHRQQHQQTLQIITTAEARGQTRLIEMNRHVADNLEKIITALEADDGAHEETHEEATADAS